MKQTFLHIIFLLSATVYGQTTKNDYQYKNYEFAIHQNIAGADVALNLTRKLAFHVYYEGTFDTKADAFHRLNTKIIQRF